MGSVPLDEKALFNAAREIEDREAREAYLASACGGDGPALERIRALLRAYDERASFLESPAVELPPETPAETVGTSVGPFKLLERIGEGGFGVVFMAEQTAPVRRRVALKVLKPGMDTRQVIARFEAERQALALMDHPNIARVLDAGTTASGRPYFVMELVRGVPITEYCDAHHLTPRARLELFVSVCHAVQHAHQKGIIHRDIKPSNVLVTQHDDRPMAKVIDFGIAKATSGQLTDKTLFTGFAQLIGTPLYMSPEQASLNALDVDTRSDVYSLGVLLYELLTGATPFDEARLKQAAFDEIRRIIREEEPPKPSTRLSTAETLASLAAKRGTEPARLTKQVRGELDWIVMKALEKDRSRRYETANGLAMDVQRHLADEAVTACPPSVGYRLRKLLRRNRRAFAAAAAAGVLLLVVAGGLGWAARDAAGRQARTSEAVSNLLDQAEQAIEADALDVAGTALDAAEKRSAEGGAEDLRPRIARSRADLALLRELEAIDDWRWTALGGLIPNDEMSMNKWKAALEAYGLLVEEDRLAEAVQRVNGSRVRERLLRVLDAWLVSGGPPSVRALLQATDPDPYRDAVRGAMVARDMATVVRLTEQPEVFAQPPRFVLVLGRLPSIPVERRRAAMMSALRGRPGDFGLLMAIGGTYWADARTITTGPGDDHERVRWSQAAVAVRPANVVARVRLGTALFQRGDLDGAIAHWEEAMRIAPQDASIRWNLGGVWHKKKDLDKAVSYHREAVRLAPTADTHYALANVLQAKKDLDGAAEHYQKAIDLGHPPLAYSRLGDVWFLKGNTRRAIKAYRKALAGSPDLVDARVNLSVLLSMDGDLDESIQLLEEAAKIRPDSAVVLANLGGRLLDNRDLEGAHLRLTQALEIDPHNATALQNLGCVHQARGELAQAIERYRASLDADPSSHTVHDNLGQVLRRSGDYAGAIAAHRKAIELMPDYALAHFNLAVALLEDGHFADALAAGKAARDHGMRSENPRGDPGALITYVERMMALETRLPEFLAGGAADAGDLVQIAGICLDYRERYLDAARLYVRAFAADPTLATTLNKHRFNAACAAVNASAGLGQGAEALDAAERTRLRGLAFEWLQAELAAQKELSARDPTAERNVRDALRWWLEDKDLKTVRDPESLAALPEEERERWTKLWDEVKASAGKASDGK